MLTSQADLPANDSSHHQHRYKVGRAERVLQYCYHSYRLFARDQALRCEVEAVSANNARQFDCEPELNAAAGCSQSKIRCPRVDRDT